LTFKENQPEFLTSPLFPEEEAASIMQGILQGLHNIHKMNYIHRDIKPENIQLAPKGMPHD
jgi:serine/threonine protein kinase